MTLLIVVADISELLLCRQKPMMADASHGQNPSVQLPVCIPPQTIHLYTGAGLRSEFSGRFTTVNRGVWQQGHPDEQIQIARKLLKTEYRATLSHVSPSTHIRRILNKLEICI